MLAQEIEIYSLLLFVEYWPESYATNTCMYHLRFYFYFLFFVIFFLLLFIFLFPTFKWISFICTTITSITYSSIVYWLHLSNRRSCLVTTTLLRYYNIIVSVSFTCAWDLQAAITHTIVVARLSIDRRLTLLTKSCSFCSSVLGGLGRYFEGTILVVTEGATKSVIRYFI